MHDSKDYKRFENLTYDNFRKMALDSRLSPQERIGFPTEYRTGYERLIFQDLASKLKALRENGRILADIGCGCSPLELMIISRCLQRHSKLLLVDSEEMLSQLPNKNYVEKFACRFPECPRLFARYTAKVDGIIVYSVLQHVFLESNVFNFIDSACRLLKEGGEMLLGDLPNLSMRKRFFLSPRGKRYHQRFTGRKGLPTAQLRLTQEMKIDDGVIFGILQRYRNSGYHTYLLPQDDRLPMANRREDVLIRKP